jgi:biofilm PGA synthesis N-glycosyltransferase PgaC
VFGKVLTVSGVTAAYKRDAFVKCGLFDSDTVTEDIDMTWKLQRKGWDIRYEPRAISWILSPESLKGLWQQRVRWAQGGLEVLKKHYRIWFDFRERRFWPVYLEYVVSTAWAFCLGFLVLSWVSLFLLYLTGVIPLWPQQPFFPPAWTGSVLALMCLMQSLVSLYIDSKYEKKTLFKYYFWIIWYPFFYWIISASAVFVGFFNVFIKKGGVSVTWDSPDRGLQAP